METEWAFLQPWRESLCSVLQLPASAHDTGEFLAAFECWPDEWGDESALRNCGQVLPARAEKPRSGCEKPLSSSTSSRRWTTWPSSRSCLSTFIHWNPPQQGTKGRPHVFWPTWECQLDGKLSSEDAVTTTSAVTWGQLFGCPLDPWKHSKEFRAAMNKLEKIKFKKGGKQHNKAASISWQVFGEFLFIFQEPVNQGRAIRAAPLSHARVNAGFLLGTLVCGRPMFLPAGNSRSALERSGTCTRWDLQLSGISGKGFGAMLSAFSDRYAADDGIRNDPVYWAWLTYAFWSKASQSSVQTLEISQINLTEEHVNTIKHVLTIIYPGPKAATGSARSRFGYVDMKKGTRVRPTGERNRVLELSQDRCCRAFYDESSLDNVANAVIPGFEICKVKLLNGMTKFVGDTLTSRKFGPTMSASGIRSQFDTHRR
ncbi:hypothetical protein PHYSODRAFT_303214 [Phytophthora sojae]|uniref:Uncharacterized protein n=1 Tax=Phytophthora sojae (strain P6497) TaxID=1094619 RepID=G4ZRD5_PHYSP|nr:hypothetical protein PHYSODRAFT_303214 [Phytophthora sojae]EGZ13820.1 hypothetical protein PHYSODRAFT_303214 [Phytophthora sojae]|eukprot:XP_009531249.1 hypothetical protein PHYSODRAFT_303214 [Phytophthora sojae]